MRLWLSVLTLLTLLVVVFSSGCLQREESIKLPAIKVVFSHYIIAGEHLLKIKNVSAVWINKSVAPKLYVSPPFPGIHIYALYSSGYTPVTYLPIDTVGDEIVAYVGFESPDKVPKKNELIIVVVDVVNERGKIMATAHKRIAWNLE